MAYLINNLLMAEEKGSENSGASLEKKMRRRNEGRHLIG